LCGRVSWPNGVVHRRTIEIGARSIVVRDELDGHGVHSVVSSLPLDRVVDGIEAEGPLGARLEDRWAAERLFERVPRPALVQRGTLELPAEIGWRIGLL
jgi:hypothetical protein